MKYLLSRLNILFNILVKNFKIKNFNIYIKFLNDSLFFNLLTRALDILVTKIQKYITNSNHY